MTRSRDLANLADSTEFTAADNTKLDGIETSATADQTNAEIKTAVEAGADIALAGNPTTTTQSAGNNTTRVATTAFTQAAITALVGSVPATLDTLAELGDALGDNPNYATSTSNLIGTKMPLAGGAFTGAVTTNSTFDGVDIATRDGVLTTTTNTANAALPKAGGTMSGALNVDAINNASGNLNILSTQSILMKFDSNNDQTNREFNIQSNTGTQLFKVKETGEVYISTNDGSTNSLVNSLMITNTSTGTTTTGFGGEIRFQAERNNGVVQNTGRISSVAEVNAGSNISSGLGFWTSTAGTLNERLRINFDGSIAIGNTVASSMVGTASMTIGTGASGEAAVHTVYTNSNTYGALYFADGTSGSARFQGGLEYQHPDNSLRFISSGSERLRLNTHGQVNIRKGSQGIVAPLQYDGLVIQNDDATGIRLISDQGNSNVGHGGIGIDNGNMTISAKGSITFDTGFLPTDNLYVGRVERMGISSAGIVTKPYQPFFNTTGTLYTQSASAFSTIAQNSLTSNVGGHMASTGIFTAPVAGNYFFSFWGLSYPHGNHVCNIRYLKNGSLVGQTVQFGGAGTSHEMVSGSIILNLAAGNNIRLQFFQASGSSAKAYPSQWNMSGYLIG